MQNNNDDTGDDLPGSAVELESKNKVRTLNYCILVKCAILKTIRLFIVKSLFKLVCVILHYNYDIFFFVQFLEKLNRQERVIEEVKLVLKPHYNKKHITKEQYKDIMRKAVPKVNNFERKVILNNKNISMYGNVCVDLS